MLTDNNAAATLLYHLLGSVFEAHHGGTDVDAH